MAKKKPTSTDLTNPSEILAEFAANALISAELLGVKKKVVDGFSLDDSERTIAAELPRLSAALKKQLSKTDATFTVANIASVMIAVAESLLDGEPLERRKLLSIATKLIDCLQSNLVPTVPAQPSNVESGNSTKTNICQTVIFSNEKAMPKRKPETDAVKHAAVEEIAGLVDAFCREHLNEEYAELCHRLTGKLARKRPSPLVSGKPNSWACGIVRTIGWVNFLDDRSQQPHMKLTAIDKEFGVGESTGQGKSMLIRKTLKIRPMDPEWSLRSKMDQNPMAWMIQVNGYLVDARILKREIQEEALRKGLIPYIPERPSSLMEEDEEGME